MFPLLAAMASSCTGIETGRAAETRAMAIPAWTCFKGRLKHARRWTIATPPTAAEVYCFLAGAGRKKKPWTLHCMQRCGASYRVCLALQSAGGGLRDGWASVEALGEPGADCRRGAPTAARCRPLQAGRCPLGDRCRSWGPYRGAGPPLKGGLGGLARRRLARPATPGHGDFTRRHPPASTLVDSSRHPGCGQAWQGR